MMSPKQIWGAFWRSLIAVPIGVLAIYLCARAWGDHFSQPGQAGNAKISWGQMCQGFKCQPAAVLYGAIPVNIKPLIAILKTRPQVKILCLDSQGGYSLGAAGLAQWIGEQKYDTCLPQFPTTLDNLVARCASACTTIFVAGQRRTMAPGALFQVHTGALAVLRDFYGEPQEYGPIAKPPSALVRFVEPINAAAANFSALWQPKPPSSAAGEKLKLEAIKTPSYRIRTVPPQDLLEWGVLTEPVGQAVVFR